MDREPDRPVLLSYQSPLRRMAAGVGVGWGVVVGFLGVCLLGVTGGMLWMDHTRGGTDDDWFALLVMMVVLGGGGVTLVLTAIYVVRDWMLSRSEGRRRG